MGNVGFFFLIISVNIEIQRPTGGLPELELYPNSDELNALKMNIASIYNSCTPMDLNFFIVHDTVRWSSLPAPGVKARTVDARTN